MAAGSGFVRLERSALGLTLDWQKTDQAAGNLRRRDPDGHDRPRPGGDAGVRPAGVPRGPALVPRPAADAGSRSRRANTSTPRPSAPAADGCRGIRWPPWPARSRPRPWRSTWPGRPSSGWATTPRPSELFLAYDLGLDPREAVGPRAVLHVPRSTPRGDSARRWRGTTDCSPTRSAAARREQGLWMPFAKISQVEGWQDFGFQFKEGNDETAWDDEARDPHLPLYRADDVVDDDAARHAAHARRRRWPKPGGGRKRSGNRQAQALLTSGYHDENGPDPGPAAGHALVQRRGVEHEFHARHRGRGDGFLASSGTRNCASGCTARSGRATWTASTSIRARATSPTNWTSAATISPPPTRR